MKLYIDTLGHSKAHWRNAPKGARFAAHTEHGVVELYVEPDGSWAVNLGPTLGQAGSYRQVARGGAQSQQVGIALWHDDDGGLNAQAYVTLERARRDFKYNDVEAIVQSTVQP